MKYDTKWLNEMSRSFLAQGYLQEGEVAETRLKHIADHAENILRETPLNPKSSQALKDNITNGFSKKMQSYLEKGWISLSSPIWSNYGTDRGLSISCYSSRMQDSVESILDVQAEIGMQSKLGGGTSCYLGNLRARGSEVSVGGVSYGPAHFCQLLETTVNIISQGNVRRGNCAVYLPVEHPDILEFLTFHDESSPIKNLSFAVTITDEWMESLLSKEDPEKLKIWKAIVDKRFETGYPYIYFTDNANYDLPDWYKDAGLKATNGNLCNEINNLAADDESFVCCLSSVNLEKYDEWKNTDLIETMITFLDTNITEFINKTKDIPMMERSRKFAINQRSLGLGVLGWHSFLQSKSIPFDSREAAKLNYEIFNDIDVKSKLATHRLANIFSPCPIASDYNVRNAQRLAIAPTTSSAFILGQVSPSIEPLRSNYFIKDLAKGKFSVRNKHLEKILEELGKNTDEIWLDIGNNDGSVQHLDFLTDHQKEVFKTFKETSQHAVIDQAGIRAQFIDQSQSLNLMIPEDTTSKESSVLMIKAWQLGIKSLYYQRSTSPVKSTLRTMAEGCVACEG